MAVCKAAEKVFRMFNGRKPSPMAELMSVMECRTLQELVGSGVFLSTEHALDAPLGEAGHGVTLMRKVTNQYLRIRSYDYGKKVTEELQGQKIRSVYSKLVLFKGQ